MKYTTEQLEIIAGKLREMPKVDNRNQQHSKQESVKILLKEITELQKRGYTLEQISETLKGEGLSIATPTLKSYMQRAKPAKKSAPDTQEEAPKTALKKQINTKKSTFIPNVDSDEI